MPDFDYDVHKEELKLQKQQWAEELAKEQEQHELKSSLCYSCMLFVGFVLLLFLPVTLKSYYMFSLLCFFYAIIFLVNFIWVSHELTKEKIAVKITIVILSAVILFSQIFGPSYDLLTKVGTGICNVCAGLGIILSLYLMKFFKDSLDG